MLLGRLPANFEVLSSSSSFTAIVNVLNAVYCIAQALRTHHLGCDFSVEFHISIFCSLQSTVRPKVLEFSAFLYLRRALPKIHILLLTLC